MSEHDTEGKHGRRAAAVLLTGLVAGAALGAVASEHGKSIRDQIAESFTPGARDAQPVLGSPQIVVMGD